MPQNVNFAGIYRLKLHDDMTKLYMTILMDSSQQQTVIIGAASVSSFNILSNYASQLGNTFLFTMTALEQLVNCLVQG